MRSFLETLPDSDSVDGAFVIDTVPQPDPAPVAVPVVLEPRRRMVADASSVWELASLKEVFQHRAHVIRVVLHVVPGVFRSNPKANSECAVGGSCSCSCQGCFCFAHRVQAARARNWKNVSVVSKRAIGAIVVRRRHHTDAVGQRASRALRLELSAAREASEGAPFVWGGTKMPLDGLAHPPRHKIKNQLKKRKNKRLTQPQLGKGKCG